MQKRFIFGTCIMLLGLLCACGSTSEKIVETSAMMEKKSDTEYETIIEEEVDGAESVTETELQDGEAEVPLMVMVKGELYYATGRESELTGRCGTMDGNITSTVAEGETPTKDNQSNFGIGYGYQYVTEKTIEIPMNNIWYVFEKKDDTVNESSEMMEENVNTSVVLENPSWEYYLATENVSEAVPFQLTLVEESANQITDIDEWFAKNELDYLNIETDEEYHCRVGDDRYVNIYKDGQFVTGIDFSNYMYSEDYVEAEIAFVEEMVGSAVINHGILYVSTFHYTYAALAPSNAYITAISLEDYSVIWKSQPLVCNAYNFTIVEDVLFCGYGFTDEADYLYQLDKITGRVLDKTELKSKPDYLIYKDGKLYVRTYNTDYIFGVE